MNTLADKAQENKSQSAANHVTHKPSAAGSAFQFVDNRPDSVAHRNLQEMANNSPQVAQLMAFQETADEYSTQQQQPAQNNTGLPDNLKTGIENLSGVSLDDVRVHYHSEKPAQLQARAYTQWTDIHLAPGQEKHLPHEAWHVVQQKQGRVRPTIQMKGQVSLNDETQLEREADVMGKKATSPSSVASRVPPASKTVRSQNARKAPIQRLTLLSYNPVHNRPDTDVIAGFNHSRFPMTPNEVTLAALYSGYANVAAAPGNCKH